MKTLRSADIAAGLFLMVLGVLTLWASSQIVTTMEHRLSPRALPYTVGILIIGCGAGMAFKARRSQSAGSRIAWPDRAGVGIVLVTLVAVGLYNAFLNLLGLPLATFLYVGFSIWSLKPGKWITAAVTALVCGLLSHFVFIRMLGLSFPEGTLF